MTELKKLSLHNFHEHHGARFGAFGNWEMPIQYTSILEEHTAVRENSGLFDVSHMGEFILSGSDSAVFLDHLLVNKISITPVGKAVYSPMCNNAGGIVDDLIVYRIGTHQFLVCVNAGNIETDFNWVKEQADGLNRDVLVENHSDLYNLLALQGPASEAILMETGLQQVKNIKRFCHIPAVFGNENIRVCRTGYTGEDGFEIYLSPDTAEDFANSIMENGSRHGLKLCGLAARDSLRLEAGFPLYGHELSATISPLEAGLAWTVKFKKKDFIGKKALLKQLEAGITRKLVHFRLTGPRIARMGMPVIDAGGSDIGSVLSGTYSPTIKRPIGSALIKSSSPMDALFVDLRGNLTKLEVAKAPLHKSWLE